MILRRLGNKKKIARKIQSYFPPHKIYIEPFFGAGGMLFNKPKVKYNLVNDLDSDVFNLFQVVMNQKEELEKAFYIIPIHSDLLNYWKVNKETDPIKKALRFLFLSNFTYLGKQDTCRSNPDNSKRILFDRISETQDFIFDVQFFNKDFEKFISSISLGSEKGKLSKDAFYYNDPPYIQQTSTYENKSWDKADFIRLLDANEQTGCKFAISEFDNDFVIQEAKARNLNVYVIGERKNLKNRRTEILITNYKKVTTIFDL